VAKRKKGRPPEDRRLATNLYEVAALNAEGFARRKKNTYRRRDMRAKG
jgi:hypothetical protein